MKGRDLTFEEFSKRVYELYGNRYDISKVDLDNRDEKGRVIIIYHHPNGSTIEFPMSPSNFLRGKTTYPDKTHKKTNLAKLVCKCKEIYGDLYDLSRIESDSYDEKYNIWIKCPKHGWVQVNMYEFQKGKGCKLCKKEEHHYKYTTKSYIEACKKVHGDKYDTSTIVYNGIENDVTVRCYKHGLFTLTADQFLRGHGCKYCGYDKQSELNRKPLKQYIKDAKKVHGDKYIIDETIGYTTAKSPVYPICPIHGRFEIDAGSFLNGCGCAECYGNKPSTNETFVERSTLLHHGYYTYTNTIYKSSWRKVTITCPIHGDFEQYPADHLYGKGCKKCAKQISKAECNIHDYIVTLVGENNVIQNDRTVLGKRKELDIYLPLHKLAIEYNGLVWHSDKFRGNKTDLINKSLKCDSLGIHLIHIFEDEWVEHEDLVKDKICHMLHKDSNKIKIGARKCQLRQISVLLAKPFLEKYHIQGWASSSIYCGAFYEGKLVGVMSFLQESQGMWNLTRFSTDINYAIPGLANKLFKFFVNEYSNDIIEVKTFLDRRWSWADINVYQGYCTSCFY